MQSVDFRAQATDRLLKAHTLAAHVRIMSVAMDAVRDQASAGNVSQSTAVRCMGDMALLVTQMIQRVQDLIQQSLDDVSRIRP